MKKWVILAIIVLALGASVGYYYYYNAQANLTTVKVISPTRGQIEAKVYTSGTIDLASKQEVRLVNPGIVKSIAVTLGATVKKGDLLLQLDTTDLDLQVKQAQAALDVAKANEQAAQNRVAELQSFKGGGEIPPSLGSQLPGVSGVPGTAAPSGQPGASSRPGSLASPGELTASSLDDAKIALAQAQAGVKQAQAALDIVENQKNNARISATINGTVLAINVTAGQPVSLQTPLIVVGDLSSLVVKADVNEVDAGKLAPGETVKISGATFGDKEFSGTVGSVAPMAETAPSAQGTQTTVPVTVNIGQGDPALKPGFTVNLAITTASKPNVLQIPLEAVFSQDKDKYVYVVNNGVLTKRKVTIGIVGDINMEISSGLSEGDLVVLNPSKNLSSGMKVRVS